MCILCCSSWKLAALGVFGALLLVLAGVSVPVLKSYSYKKIVQRVALENGSDTYDMWVEPTIPIYLQVYVLDLQNPSEVLKGEKPYVLEKGPYTYREHRKKVDISHHIDNDTVTYRQIKWYDFDIDKSIGPDTDTFTTVNMPLMTFVEYLHWNFASTTQIVTELLQLLMHEEVFISKSVHDIVWGYNDTMLEWGRRLDPNVFYTTLAGVMVGKNNTDDGTYTIYTGVRDPEKLGVISHYNGSRILPFWSDIYANMVNGTDGSLSPPFINQSMRTYMFSTDICRSVYGTYNETVRSPQGVSLWRFRAPAHILMNATENPDNSGFCTPAGNCLDTGVLNISKCQMLDGFHLPVVASFPHFHMAASKYQDAILGLNPNQPDLSVDVDIEPLSGIVMHVAKRLQINIYIRGESTNSKITNSSSELSRVREMVYPVLWLNESAAIDDAHAHQVQSELLTPLLIAHMLQYVALAAGALLILGAATLNVYYRRARGSPTRKREVNEPFISNDSDVHYDTEDYQDSHTVNDTYDNGSNSLNASGMNVGSIQAGDD